MSAQAQAVQGLVLENSSNHCYANTTVHSILWAAAGSPQGIACADYGLSRFLRWLARPLLPHETSRRAVRLWDHRAWSRVVHSWQEPDRQHDVGEFLQFIAPRIAVGHASDRWHARQTVASGAAQVMDQGTLWPLTVTTPLIAMQPPDSQDTPTLNVPISLQKLIIQWRNQASRHAMLSEPNWLPVQVSRFDAQGRKVYAPVQVSAAVYIPSFVGDTLQTTPTRYQLAATIFHLGDSLLHGHYRTALYETGRIVSITDDNVRAQPASVADVNMVQQNSYIFILRKC